MKILIMIIRSDNGAVNLFPWPASSLHIMKIMIMIIIMIIWSDNGVLQHPFHGQPNLYLRIIFQNLRWSCLNYQIISELSFRTNDHAQSGPTLTNITLTLPNLSFSRSQHHLICKTCIVLDGFWKKLHYFASGKKCCLGAIFRKSEVLTASTLKDCLHWKEISAFGQNQYS